MLALHGRSAVAQLATNAYLRSAQQMQKPLQLQTLVVPKIAGSRSFYRYGPFANAASARRVLPRKQTPLRSKSTLTGTSRQEVSAQGLFNTPGLLKRRIKQGLWVGLGLGTLASAVGIAWSPSYREQANLYTAGVFRSMATFVTG